MMTTGHFCGLEVWGFAFAYNMKFYFVFVLNYLFYSVVKKSLITILA